ncbi:MAG: acyl-protein synthetase [Gemmatimonadaceae bacterium]|nr:acyl-protein synthetase [Gemmatimonadaceae bacterium]
MSRTIEELLAAPVFGSSQAEKEATLLPLLNALTAHHAAHCAPYDRLLAGTGATRVASRLADVPWLPVGLFKSHELVSVGAPDVFKVMTSSGTTGQAVSRIILDQRTADLQTRALVRIMTHVLGPDRLPMLVLDTKSIIRNRTQFAARGAGVLGMMTFGRNAVWALDDEMDLDIPAVEAFLAKHGNAPFLMFGFTFMAWKYFIQRLADRGLDLSQGILVHSGGWKKLQDEAVDNATFRARLQAMTGLHRIYNFYGMVEQVGSVFLEGDDGFLYPPAFADVIIRDPETWDEAPVGTPGVIQVLSALPHSYPGHSILTEDMGIVHSVDANTTGRGGKAFTVIGRAPRAELRGCSDVHAFAAST